MTDPLPDRLTADATDRIFDSGVLDEIAASGMDRTLDDRDAMQDAEMIARMALEDAQGDLILARQDIARLLAENERLRDELMSLWVYLRLDINHPNHQKFGEACGVDACILCLAAETARAALQTAGATDETLPTEGTDGR